MKFTRINDHTVNCIITADDMDEQGLSIEDLFQKGDEAREFLQEIILRATQEVGYQPTSAFMPMQIAVLPDQSISVTLSENPGAAIADMLRGLADRLRQFLEDVTGEPFDGEAARGTQVDVRVGEQEQLQSSLLPILRYAEYVFSFDSLGTVSRFAKTVAGMPPVTSSLYKDEAESVFYLHLTPAAGTTFADDPALANAYAAAFIRANEYGSFVTVEHRFVLHMQENMATIIENDALERLAAL